MDCTFGASTTLSMMTNFRVGYSAATVLTALAWLKPTAMIGLCPLRAKLRKACSRCVSFCGSKSRTSMPVALVKAAAPSWTPSLNDLSNLPPMSKRIAGVIPAALAAPENNSITAANQRIPASLLEGKQSVRGRQCAQGAGFEAPRRRPDRLTLWLISARA